VRIVMWLVEVTLQLIVVCLGLAVQLLALTGRLLGFVIKELIIPLLGVATQGALTLANNAAARRNGRR
jgi:hypothetical protein